MECVDRGVRTLAPCAFRHPGRVLEHAAATRQPGREIEPVKVFQVDALYYRAHAVGRKNPRALRVARAAFRASLRTDARISLPAGARRQRQGTALAALGRNA